MTALTATAAQVAELLAATATPVVTGPPFRHPPAGPCYAVGLPRHVAQDGTTPVWSTVVDVRCYPTSAGNYDELLALADAAAEALALGGFVVTSDPGLAQYVDADLSIYTLTCERG